MSKKRRVRNKVLSFLCLSSMLVSMFGQVVTATGVDNEEVSVEYQTEDRADSSGDLAISTNENVEVEVDDSPQQDIEVEEVQTVSEDEVSDKTIDVQDEVVSVNEVVQEEKDVDKAREVNAVEYSPTIKIRGVCIDNNQVFRFRVSPVAEYSGVTYPDSMEVSSSVSDAVSFGSISFGVAGAYEFLIEQVPSDITNVIQDSRVWKLKIVVENMNNALQVAKHTYSVFNTTSEDDKSNEDCAEFIETTSYIPGYSTTTVEKAKRVMESMTLEELVGQTIIGHYTNATYSNPEDSYNFAQDLVTKYHIGGYVLFKQDFSNNTPEGIKAHIGKIQQSTKVPLIMSVDEEGGRVVRISSLPAYGHEAYPYAQDLVKSGGVEAVRADAEDKASFLKSLGLNCNLAPVADTSVEGGVIYTRTYGGDGVENAKYVATSVGGMESNGLGTCLKHFPGYGSTTSDTHAGFAVNYLKKEDLLYNDLLPFRAGLSAGGKMVMVTHNMFDAIDPDNPASLSPAVYSMLRDEIGYGGLAVTDDLAMGAITQFVGSNSSCVMAFNAGADMVMTPYPNKEFPQMLAQVNSGGISMDKLETSVLRILCWKVEHGVLDVEMPEEAVYIDANGNEAYKGSFDSVWNVAVASGGGTVKLIQSISTSETYDNEGTNLVLDLNGCTLNYDVASNNSLFTVSGGSFSIDNTVSGAVITPTNIVDTSISEGEANYSNRVLVYHDSSISGHSGTSRKIDFNVNGLGHINSTGSGSVVKVTQGDFTLKNGIIENCKNSAIVSPEGGNGSVSIVDGAILDGSVTGNGGAVGIQSANVQFNMSGGYIVNCEASGNGGAVCTSGSANISGRSLMVLNTATDGGSVYCNSLAMSGNTLVGYSTATNWGGGIYVVDSIELGGNCCVYRNHANRLAGGIYAEGESNVVHGSPCVWRNTAFNGQQEGLYLKSGNYLTIGEDGLNMYARFVISSESTDNMIPVAIGGGLEYDKLQCFIPSLSSYSVVYVDGDIYLSNGDGANIGVNVILDGRLYNLGTLNTVLETQLSDGRTVSYFNLRSVVGLLSDWGLDWDKYKGDQIFGYQSDDGTVIVPDIEPTKLNDKWRIYIDPSVDVQNANLIYLPNGSGPGSIEYGSMVSSNGFWSVEVQDMYSTFMENQTSESSRQYVTSGSSVDFELTYLKAPWNWRIFESEDNNFTFDIKQNGDKVNISISDIYSPVLVLNGREDEVAYTVQYYAYVSTLDLTMESGGYALPVIDTSGAKLPENTIDQNLKYLKIDSGTNQIQKKSNLVCMYEDTKYLYSMNPRLIQVNRLSTDSGYDLDQMWVLKQGRNPDSIDVNDFDVYRLEDFDNIESLCDLHLTNDKKYVSRDTIYVSNGSVIRFVYNPSTTIRDKEVEFYDYDISDGHIYPDSSYSTKNPTSSQTSSTKAYANTAKQGINNPANYNGSGAKIGFGNANTGTGMNTEKWNGYPINSRGTAYNGCTFGLVDGLGYSEEEGYYPIFSDGIVAPKLFGSGDAVGKTKHDGISASFEKIGDTYTLSSINTETPLSNLQTFAHPVCNGKPYTNIWTNNFWPMDNVDSFGTDGHDLKFGDYNSRANRIFSSNSQFPIADDGTDHNSYFGMSFNINFSIPKGYKGPMEYCFFGDDDMWVFLDDKKIIDIGGVHSSVGEYANLWDYIEDTGDESNHTLTVFYTERGASGSTCWMEFTLPRVKFGSTDRNITEGSIEVYKDAVGDVADPKKEYDFSINILDELGENPKDDYSYYRVSKGGEISEYGLIQRGVGKFKLASGEHIVVPYVPAGYRYTIDESEYGCLTSVSSDNVPSATSNSYMGVSESLETDRVYYTNDFNYMDPKMPNTGMNSLYTVYIIGFAVLFLSGLAYGSLSYKQKKLKM